MAERDLSKLPANLPAPQDDGAAAHLAGYALPHLELEATNGTRVNLSHLAGRVVVFAFPRTGQPGKAPLVADWDEIPGARGCTPQVCRYRDLAAEFAALDCRVFGLSTQSPEYQREMATRLAVPFPILSDADLTLVNALKLPTMTLAGEVLIKRMSWLAIDGRIVRVTYPVFPSDRNADVMLQIVASTRTSSTTSPSR